MFQKFKRLLTKYPNPKILENLSNLLKFYPIFLTHFIFTYSGSVMIGYKLDG